VIPAQIEEQIYLKLQINQTLTGQISTKRYGQTFATWGQSCKHLKAWLKAYSHFEFYKLELETY